MLQFYNMKTVGTILMLVVGFMFNSKVETTVTDGFAKRETVGTVNNVKGIVWRVGDTDVYMIECGEKHLKLNAFNLPAQYKKDNTTITFSGNIKLTEPLEDDCGELFEVTTITE